MSRTNQRLGKDIVYRVSGLSIGIVSKLHIKRKLLQLKCEDRDEYLGYLEEESWKRDDERREDEREE